jgi:hypothetical protein
MVDIKNNKASKTSMGVVIVNVPPPRWESHFKKDDQETSAPTVQNLNFNNIFIYNFYTQNERTRYSFNNPIFNQKTMEQIKTITGKNVESDGFNKISSGKVPSYIRLAWKPPGGFDKDNVASKSQIDVFRYLVGLTKKRPSDMSTSQVLAMSGSEEYDSFEVQQRDFVNITNEYLDMFSAMGEDGSTTNNWFALEVDSTGYAQRQEFLWKDVVGKAEYKNMLSVSSTKEYSADGLKTTPPSMTDKYFNNSAAGDSKSVVDVRDSALLENLDYPETEAIPEDVTIVMNSEFLWRMGINSSGFSGELLGMQARVKNLIYWKEFMDKLGIQKSSGDIETIVGEPAGPLERTLSSAACYDVEVINSFTNSGISDFKLVGFVIEKEQAVEPGEDDEVKYRSEKFPLIFVSCFNNEEGTAGDIPNRYLDAALNYDKEYKYTIRGIVTFSITIPLGNTGDMIKRSYFVNTPYSNILRVETRETKAPSYPRDISAFYEYYKKALTLNWAFPVDKQRDSTYFAIFRRNTMYEPFRLLQIYDFNYSIEDEEQSLREIKVLLEYSDFIANKKRPPNRHDLVKRLELGDPNTIYSDFTFKSDRDYIYTVCAIDAHGQISNYGAQLKINLDAKTHNLSVRQISPPGAPLVFPNWYVSTRAFQDSARTARYRRAVVKFRPDYKKIKLGRGEGAIKDVVKCMDPDAGGHLSNCYYLQILNPDRNDDIVLKYQIDDRTDFNMGDFAEIEEVAGLLGVSKNQIKTDDE